MRAGADTDGDAPPGVRVLSDEEADASLVRRRRLLRPRLVAVGLVAAVLVAIWALTPSPTFWPIWPLIGLGVYAALDALMTLVALPLRDSDIGPGDRTAGIRTARMRRFLLVKVGLAGIVNAATIAVWLAAGNEYFWPVWVLLGTSVALVIEYARYRYVAQ
jgi:hypothetical protein